MAEYGQVAIGTYLTIFALSLAGFTIAIKVGFTPDSAAAQTGLIAAAYVATKAIQPLRILLTLALTPAIARIVRKKSSKESSKETAETPQKSTDGL